jgi:hypothetical protein
MRKAAIGAFLVLAVGFAVMAVMSAVEGHDMLSSVNYEPTGSSLNQGVFSNAFLAIVFALPAVVLIRSGARKEK